MLHICIKKDKDMMGLYYLRGEVKTIAIRVSDIRLSMGRHYLRSKLIESIYCPMIFRISNVFRPKVVLAFSIFFVLLCSITIFSFYYYIIILISINFYYDFCYTQYYKKQLLT